MFKVKASVVLALTAVAATASAENEFFGSKPTGLRFFDNRLTLRPYVDLSYSYDSNIDTTKNSADDSYFMVEPGLNFSWRGDRWMLTGKVWYSYKWYQDYGKEMNGDNYGESLNYSWTNVGEDGKGWNLMLSERYAWCSQNDSLQYTDGRGIWRDREILNVSGVLERRFTERWHAAVQGQYDTLDYDNKSGYYAPLYGWDEWSAGLEAGYVASKWTDILINGGYSHYLNPQSYGNRRYDNESESWTIQGGIGTHATEKISYRVLAGWSVMNYGGVSNADNGWTYSLSGNWRILRNLQWSALGSSYYQPSERALGTAMKVYSLSTGLSYLMFGDRLTLTGNVSWRMEDNVYNDTALSPNENYSENILSFRLGADYIINRWVSVFGTVSYEEEYCDERSIYEYDRFRATLGLRLHY